MESKYYETNIDLFLEIIFTWLKKPQNLDFSQYNILLVQYKYKGIKVKP